MTLLDVVNSLNNRFTSGNDIPVERATITEEQWEILERNLSFQNPRDLGQCPNNTPDCEIKAHLVRDKHFESRQFVAHCKHCEKDVE